MMPVIAVLAFIGPATAATILWNAPQPISGAGDVSTTGTYFGSWAPYNGGANMTPINGVTFQGFDDFGMTNTGFADGGNFFGSHTTPDTNYNTLLGYGAYSNGVTASFTANGNGSKPLTIGSVYQIQFWVSDARNLGGGTRSETINGSAPLLYPATGGMGQYVIGTFTADATSQVFTLNANASAQVNLVQLRTIPEPSAALMGSLCMAGTLLRRRRQ